jgi:hypothetical protein
MAHDQEVVGSNHGTVYWMDASDLLAIKLKKNWKIKGSQMGHTAKQVLRLESKVQRSWKVRFGSDMSG